MASTDQAAGFYSNHKYVVALAWNSIKDIEFFISYLKLFGHKTIEKIHNYLLLWIDGCNLKK